MYAPTGRVVHGATLYKQADGGVFMFKSSGSGMWVMTENESNFAGNMGHLRYSNDRSTGLPCKPGQIFAGGGWSADPAMGVAPAETKKLEVGVNTAGELAIGGEAVAFAVAGFGPQAARLGPTAAAAAEPLLADSDLANPAELSAKVAVVRRGGCPFLDKARRVQAAGAVAMVVVNTEDAPKGMVDENCGDITIPCICIGQADGERLLLGGSGVAVLLAYDSPAPAPAPVPAPAHVAPEQGTFATVDGSRWGQVKLCNGRVDHPRYPVHGMPWQVQMMWLDDRSTSKWTNTDELISVVAAKSDIPNIVARAGAGAGARAGAGRSSGGGGYVPVLGDYVDDEGNKGPSSPFAFSLFRTKTAAWYA